MVALVVAAVLVIHKGAGGDPLDKIQSLRHAPADAAVNREQALGRAQDFVARFNTYGPDLLDSSGKMPAYEDLANEMTAKFATVFDKNVGYAEQTVAKIKVKRSAQVYGTGVATIDDDTAQIIVAGTAQFAYPNPKKKGAWVTFDPERFRYDVFLVKQHGEWLIDDLDDLDDGLPSLGESAGQPAGQTPSAPPSLSGSTTGGGN